jgi:hypothetical protein
VTSDLKRRNGRPIGRPFLFAAAACLLLDQADRSRHMRLVLLVALENFREFLPARGLTARNAQTGKPRVNRGFPWPPFAS